VAILFAPIESGNSPNYSRACRLARAFVNFTLGEFARTAHRLRINHDGTVLSDTGEVLGVSVIERDLTFSNLQIEDVREAHRRANETVSTLETLHASSPIGFGFFDRDCRYVHVNDALARFDGTNVKSAVGRTIKEVVPVIWTR